MQMHAFTRPSPQFRLKVRDALLRSLHHSSLYRRLIIATNEKGARTKTVGRALHKKLTYSGWEGTSLLKFIYGQLYNGKLAKRYGHDQTDECPICTCRTRVHVLLGNKQVRRNPFFSTYPVHSRTTSCHRCQRMPPAKTNNL